MSFIAYPFDNREILVKKRKLKRLLLEQSNLLEKRIAIISGSTIGEFKDVLEVFLLNYGIKPKFYVGQYNCFYEEVMFDNNGLLAFQPELIYIHTSLRNASDPDIADKLLAVWEKIKNDYCCTIVQNNFEYPLHEITETMQIVDSLNKKIDAFKEINKDFYICNIRHVSARIGLINWHDERDYVISKYALSVKAIPCLAHDVAKIIKAAFGKNKKCLVLDLDNTLWGGEIGDLGADGIELGIDSPKGEGFIAFQKYVKSLHGRGVILAVCSKNDEKLAMDAFCNPNMVLKLDDFAAFYANWDSKAENICKIAKQLNIFAESMVFIDDNPVERELVKTVLPEVSVPDANDFIEFIEAIEGAGYFYTANVSVEDTKRNNYYLLDAIRDREKKKFVDYGEYLRSLNMASEIRPFVQSDIERITQLINKTNQFNLTTKRYSISEVEKISQDDDFITLYTNLVDKFGNNGIVSALIGEKSGEKLHIRLWVMSCRVFNRELELAVFDCLVDVCKKRGIKKIIGYYFKTEKNGYVANLLEALGFEKATDNTWEFDLTAEYQSKNINIKLERDFT